jgi:hypothetical protein
VGQTVTVSSPRTWLSLFLRSNTEKHLFITNPRMRIFLVSFTMLFFELLCIRWVPSYVRYLSYFNNFLLMASFLGIGLGMLAARRKRFWFPPFPLMLLILVIVVAVNRFDLRVASTQVLYYGAGEAESAQAENFIVLPIIFGLVTLCFIPLGRAFGQLITQVRPLTAYTFDIIGSLLGIAFFSIIAYFASPPAIWFALLAIPLLLLASRRTIIPAILLLLISLSIAWQLQTGAYWSPYYKIVLRPVAHNGYNVDVNDGEGYQAMIPYQYKEPFYRFVYQTFKGQSFHNALILGAGSGSDVATALAYGVQKVTAVDIDPIIIKLGAKYNPDHPYSNPRVQTVANDGRAFLQTTTQHYDLIIFGLPDSLTLTSSNTNLRLESFLLTEQALEEARAHLTSNGVIVLYNYYRDQWLIQKLANMVGHAFNQQPLIQTYGGWGRAAVIMAGPRLATLPAGKFGPYHETPSNGNQRLRIIGTGYYPLTNSALATDDWPFLYLQGPSFPLLYIEGLAMVLFFTLAGTLTLAPRRVLRRFNWHMFFLGVAFMLLEVKSLTTFSLLFGSTWLVNSLVFFAILSSVLLAVLVNRHFNIRRIRVFYVLLFAILLLNLLVPPETLLVSNTILRYLLSSAMAFTPVFLANIIFANSFRDSETSDIAFASNLLGIMIGGGLEYFSMLFGYRMLLVLVILFYACALLLWRRQSVAEVAPALSLASKSG